MGNFIRLKLKKVLEFHFLAIMLLNRLHSRKFLKWKHIFNLQFPFCRGFQNVYEGYFRYYDAAVMNNLWILLTFGSFGLNVYAYCDEYDNIITSIYGNWTRLSNWFLYS